MQSPSYPQSRAKPTQRRIVGSSHVSSAVLGFRPMNKAYLVLGPQRLHSAYRYTLHGLRTADRKLASRSKKSMSGILLTESLEHRDGFSGLLDLVGFFFSLQGLYDVVRSHEPVESRRHDVLKGAG